VAAALPRRTSSSLSSRPGQQWRRADLQVVSASGQDQVLRSISDNGQVSILVIEGTDLVKEACRRHKTAPTAGAALGRALIGTLLMASFREEGEKTQVTWRGDGPLGSIQIIADASGNVKGKVGNPGCNPPLRQDGKFNVGAAVGRGVLAVVRSLPFTKEGWQTPYTGMTAIETGEIAEDLTQYMLESEQSQCAMGLGVSIGRDLEVNAAGGFLVSVLPFAEDETLDQLEKNILEAGSVSSMLRDGLSARDITEKLLNGLGVSDTGFTLTPTYGPCEAAALRDRMASAVASLGKAEVLDILEQEGKIEVTCEFCRDTYNFEEEEILSMVEAAEK
jgi:molecular chaperone Hsp33